jgi:hypothetical protein
MAGKTIHAPLLLWEERMLVIMSTFGDGGIGAGLCLATKGGDCMRAYLGMIHRVNSFRGALWPMLSKLEKASYSPTMTRHSQHFCGFSVPTVGKRGSGLG